MKLTSISHIAAALAATAGCAIAAPLPVDQHHDQHSQEAHHLHHQLSFGAPQHPQEAHHLHHQLSLGAPQHPQGATLHHHLPFDAPLLVGHDLFDQHQHSQEGHHLDHQLSLGAPQHSQGATMHHHLPFDAPLLVGHGLFDQHQHSQEGHHLQHQLSLGAPQHPQEAYHLYHQLPPLPVGHVFGGNLFHQHDQHLDPRQATQQHALSTQQHTLSNHQHAPPSGHLQQQLPPAHQQQPGAYDVVQGWPPQLGHVFGGNLFHQHDQYLDPRQATQQHALSTHQHAPPSGHLQQQLPPAHQQQQPGAYDVVQGRPPQLGHVFGGNLFHQHDQYLDPRQATQQHALSTHQHAPPSGHLQQQLLPAQQQQPGAYDVVQGRPPQQRQQPVGNDQGSQDQTVKDRIGDAITANALVVENAKAAIRRLPTRELAYIQLKNIRSKHEKKVGRHSEELDKLPGMNSSEKDNARRRAIYSKDSAERASERVRAILAEHGHV